MSALPSNSSSTPSAAPPTNNLSANDPLAQLRDIHLPPPIEWWPPAPGWWLLAGTLLLMISVGIYVWRRRHKQRRYRRLALQAAKTNYAQWQQHGDALAYVQALNQLLKQTALQAFPAHQVAALNGDAWLSFLDSHLPAPQFNQTTTRALANVYQAQIESVEPESLQRAAEYWLRRHRC